jgi:hypothetical protein
MSNKIGRNDPCPCGSGKKYKKCCLLKGIPFYKMIDKEGPKNKFSFEEYFKKFNTVDLLSILAALSTHPENHGKNIRIERLIFEALKSNNQSQELIDIIDFEKELSTHLGFNHYEDPPENLFTENVTSSVGNSTIYGGNFEQGAFTLNNLIKAIQYNERSFENEFKTLINSATNLLLSISNIIAIRLGHERNMVGNDATEESKILFPSNIMKIKTAFYFDKEKMHEYCSNLRIDINTLSYFILPLDQLKNYSSDIPGEFNPILNYPILALENGYLAISPTTIISALVHFIWIMSEKNKCKELLTRLFHEQVYREILLYFRKIKLDTIYSDLIIDSSSPGKVSIHKIDSDKLLLFSFTQDNGENYQNDTLFHFAPYKYPDNESMKIKKSLLAIDSSLRDNKFLYLHIYSTIGRQYQIAVKEEPGIHHIVCTAYHFICWMKSGEYDKMDLWYYCDALESFEREVVVPPFAKDFLNLFSYYKMKNNSFYLSDDKKPTHFSLLPGGSLEIIASAQRNEDPIFVHNKIESIKDLVLVPVVKHNPNVPSYISIENHGGIYIELYIPGFNCDLWIRTNKKIREMTKDEFNINKELIIAISYWLWQVKNDILPFLSGYKSKFLQLIFEFTDFNLQSKIETNKNIFNSFTIEANLDQVNIYVPFGILEYLNSGDNQGERILLSKILEGFKLLIQNHRLSNIITDNIIEKIVELRAPLGLKKMILFLDSTRFIQVDNRNLNPPFYVKEARRQKLMDIEASLLPEAYQKKGEIKLKEDKEKFIKTLVFVLLKELREKLAEFDSIEILLHIMSNNEAIIQENALLNLRVPTQVHCFKDDKDSLDKIVEHKSKSDQAIIVNRCLIEHLSIEPSFGKRQISTEFIDDICAIMSLIIFWGGVGDQIKYNLFEVNLSMLDSGRVGTNSTEIQDKFIKGFFKTKAEEYIYDSINNFSNYFLEEESFPDAKPIPSSFNKAFENQVGISFGKIDGIITLLVAVGFEQNVAVPTLSKEGLVALINKSFKVKFSISEIEAAIKFLSLWAWRDILKVPKGFQSTDISPWRSNRRLSYLQKPLILIDYGKYENAPSIFWTPRHLDFSWRYIKYLFSSARYKAEPKSNFEREISKLAKKRGKVLQNEIVNWFGEKSNVKVFEEVSISPRGSLTNTEDIGDIDVLIFDKNNKIILSIECKRTERANNSKQMVEELEQYFGQGKNKGYFQKHIIRHNWLIKNQYKLHAFLGIKKAEYKIYSFFVTYEILSIQFIRESNLPIKTISLFEFKNLSYESLIKLLELDSMGK